jgi:2-polyprenyl-3-methyl-5-hydroxy-6-metoxy-1,4-benzoquinol methylase
MGFFACGLNGKADTSRPVIDWEEPRCLLCNSDRASILLEAPDPLPGDGGLWFAVNQCQDCGLCYTSPRPSAKAMGQFYPHHYPPHQKTAGRRRFRGWRRLLGWRLGRRDPLEGLPLHGQGRLLDFGCASGAYLARMHKRGWKVMGIDVSEESVQRIRVHLGLSAVVGTLPHPELGDASFDVITMRHSLEHVHQPLEVLRAAHRLLVPGGKLIISAPNIDSLQFKWFGRHWRGLDLPRHLVHLTPDTLQLMLARSGFDVGPVRMIRHTQWVRRSAQLASKRPDAPRWQRWLRSRFFAGLALWYTFLVRRCDGMVVTAVKTEPVSLGPVRTFSQRIKQDPRFPGDRWRNR